MIYMPIVNASMLPLFLRKCRYAVAIANSYFVVVYSLRIMFVVYQSTLLPPTDYHDVNIWPGII